MNANQIKTLLSAAGIDPKTYICLSSGQVEVYVRGSDGKVDEARTRRVYSQISKVLPWAGRRSGYGSIVMREGRVAGSQVRSASVAAAVRY